MVSPATLRMAIKIAIGAAAALGRCEWVPRPRPRGKGVLIVPVLIRAAKGYQRIGARLRTTLEGVVAGVRHHAGRISTRCALLNVSPLSAGMVRRLPRPGRIARVVVVAVQAVGVGGYGPPPPRPAFVLQRVSAVGSVTSGRVVDRYVARGLVARCLRSRRRGWWGNAVMFDSRARSRVRGVDFVDIIPLVVVFVGLSVLVLVAT